LSHVDRESGITPQIGSAVSPMLSGVLAGVSLRLAFLGNAALFCGGTVVAWHWLGARQADHRAAAPPGPRDEYVPRTAALPRSVHTRPGIRACRCQERPAAAGRCRGPGTQRRVAVAGPGCPHQRHGCHGVSRDGAV